MINAKEMRKSSLAEAMLLGYPINKNLPLLEDIPKIKGLDEIVSRFLCMYAVVASSYGLPKEKAINWLKEEGLMESLSNREKRYLELDSNLAEKASMQWQVEALWALAWCAGCHDMLDFSDSCDDNFIQLLPDIAKKESKKLFCVNRMLRSKDEILAKLDLAYCLHWAVRDAEIHQRLIPGRVPGSVVIERRRALEWVVSQEAWDEVLLDT